MNSELFQRPNPDDFDEIIPEGPAKVLFWGTLLSLGDYIKFRLKLELGMAVWDGVFGEAKGD
jgi:hypothetical protein